MSAISGTDQQQPKGTAAAAAAAEDDDRNPLHRAASAGQINLVRQLLETAGNGASYPIDLPDSLGWTPLIIAASAGHREVVAYLVERGANVQAVTANSQSALHFACGKGHLEVVKLLVDNGCSLNTRDRFGYTPFIRAVLANREAVVEYLLTVSKAGKIDLDGKDKLGNSALHIACEEENLRMVQLLLEAGADVKATNGEGRTPLEGVTSQKLQRSLKDVFLEFGRPREAGAPAPVFKLTQPPQSQDI
ncbi:hypothetical protein TYRP_002868 [Tyrophagus putrescentiae]|nr:hypothetical protein TYRP_002868 [Tyrophagus putrescentiae]